MSAYKQNTNNKSKITKKWYTLFYTNKALQLHSLENILNWWQR